MSANQNQNFSLLTQDEIDTLVSFLIDKKNAVNSDVMNQQSIDKLIFLITHDRRQLMSMLDPLSCIDTEYLQKKNFRQNEQEICELRVTISDNNYLTLTAHNLNTNQTLEITPAIMSDNDSEIWGKCLSPVTFNRLAKNLGLRYTPETYEQICNHFARVNYDDESHAIPVLHLPTNDMVMETLM